VADALKGLFDPFTQADASITRRFGVRAWAWQLRAALPVAWVAMSRSRVPWG
jgi:hypothetical protein